MIGLTLLCLVGVGLGIRNSIVNSCGENQSFDFLIDLGINLVYLTVLYFRGKNIIRQKSVIEDGAEIGFINQLDRRVKIKIFPPFSQSLLVRSEILSRF